MLHASLCPLVVTFVDSPRDARSEQVQPHFVLDASSDVSWEDVGLDAISDEGSWVVVEVGGK